jgi:hypothetical protein
MIEGPPEPPERAPRLDLSDVLIGLGYIVCAAGAWLLHPATAVLLIGATIVFIGYRRG